MKQETSPLDAPLATAAGHKPHLSFWQVWNMSFGFLGIQFGFALQNANVSRIFETLGAKVEDIPILWVAAPVTGLIIQPIIGYLSDRTWNRLGRRRPYFLVGAILASAALFIMPNSPVLWVAAGMLWIMDASINISMEPFRAFVGDNLPSAQRTMGFAMQSFFIGTGAVIASMLPYMLANWFGVSNTAAAGVVPDSVKWSFYLGGGVFFLAVLWTIIRSHEYSPEELASFEENKETEGYGQTARTPVEYQANGNRQMRRGALILLAGSLLVGSLARMNLEKELFILAGGIMIVGILLAISGVLQRGGRFNNAFVTIVNDFQDMPATMKQLAWVQFFSWFSLFAMWIYTTAAVTSHVFGTSDTASELYNQGANWVGVCFAVYNGIAAVVAFLLPLLAKRFGRRGAHAICLVAGALGLLSVFVIKDYHWLLASMVGIGIAWASILSMPYAILTGALPANKMGYYMGVFNFFIVIPQIIAASILGFLLSKFFAGEAIYAMLLGGASFILAAFLVFRVEDKE
ncbi:MAG: MFS transporter [Phaeodactylibacter sp.]|nr:MFS transporter [Phaeodactylibacter sp.]